MARKNPKETAYESVYRRLLAQTKLRSALCVGLTSAGPGEGVTSMTAGLAMAAAAHGNGRVLVCDVGQGEQRLAGLLGAKMVTITSLPPEGDLRVALAATDGLDVLSIAPDLASAANEERWAHVMSVLRERYNTIIFDLGDLGTSMPALWQDRLDELLLVVDSNHTTYESLARLRKELERTGISLSGFALNKRRFYVPALIYRFIY